MARTRKEETEAAKKAAHKEKLKKARSTADKTKRGTAPAKVKTKAVEPATPHGLPKPDGMNWCVRENGDKGVFVMYENRVAGWLKKSDAKKWRDDVGKDTHHVTMGPAHPDSNQ